MNRMLQILCLAMTLAMGATVSVAGEGGGASDRSSAGSVSIEATIGPGEAVTIEAAPHDYTELVLRNEGSEDACGTLVSPDVSEQFCIKPGETLKLVKFFGGDVVITTMSATASISVTGKWL